MANETAAQLLAEAAKDYGTPTEREQRQTDATVQSSLARAHGAEAAQAPSGRRP